MSTKTSIKRIALVAVSALGFGVLSVVVPSTARAELTTTELTALQLAGAATDVSLTVREDVAITAQTIGYVVSTSDVATADDTAVLLAVFSSKPAASALDNSNLIFGASTAGSNNTAEDSGGSGGDNDAAAITAKGSGTLAAKITLDPTSGDSLTSDSNIGNLQFTPDVPGTYTVTMWHDANANTIRDSGEASRTLTVVAGSAATKLTIKEYANSTIIRNVTNTQDAYENGSLYVLQLTDSAGNATALAQGEGISIASTGCQISTNGWTGTSSDTATLSASTSPKNGRYIVNIGRTAAGNCVTTFSGAGSLAGAISGQTFTSTHRAGADEDLMTPVIDETTGVDTTTVGNMASGAASGSAVAASTAKTTVKFKLTSGATPGTASYVGVNVLDTTGAITGYDGAKFTDSVLLSSTATTGTASYSVTATNWSDEKQAATNTLAADSYVVTFVETDATTDTASRGVTITATAASTSTSLSTWNVTTINAVQGGQVSATLTLKDAFGLARTGVAITFVLEGRNALNTAVKAAVTDANGQATFTYTDIGTSTSSATDTISVSGVTAKVSVSFNAANAVDKVSVTSGDTTAGVADLSVDWKDILAGTGGPTTSAYDVTAKVTNSAGVNLAGVPVTFTVAEAGCAVPSNEALVYTDSTGVATSAVYAWLAGKCTVTATAGGKTGTGVTSFRQESTTEIRTLSGSVSGQLVTAAPKDRFGNPVVKGKIYAVITAGSGYFGSNGARSTSGETDSTGTVSFVIAGGDATVKLTTIDPTGTGLADDQSTAAAGKVRGDVATPVDFTATKAGTATTAETGVGASFAPAGISSVTLEVKGDTSSADAIEAAVEATDAANSAYEAAVVATETAEAAVAAAEEAKAAADAATAAVEALATEVSTLLAGLKTQLTTLTNTVAKILRRVKA